MNIPPEAITKASSILARYKGLSDKDRREDIIRITLTAAAPLIAAQALASVYPMIRDMADPEECWFDHHGGCQAHGYLSLEPGEKCPQAEAKEWIQQNAPIESEAPNA